MCKFTDAKIWSEQRQVTITFTTLDFTLHMKTLSVFNQHVYPSAETQSHLHQVHIEWSEVIMGSGSCVHKQKGNGVNGIDTINITAVS